MISNVAKIKAEAEKLDLMDKAAGILAELLYTDKMISEIKEYRIVMLHVSLYAGACPEGLYSTRLTIVNCISASLVYQNVYIVIICTCNMLKLN